MPLEGIFYLGDQYHIQTQLSALHERATEVVIAVAELHRPTPVECSMSCKSWQGFWTLASQSASDTIANSSFLTTVWRNQRIEAGTPGEGHDPTGIRLEADFIKDLAR